MGKGDAGPRKRSGKTEDGIIWFVSDSIKSVRVILEDEEDCPTTVESWGVEERCICERKQRVKSVSDAH